MRQYSAAPPSLFTSHLTRYCWLASLQYSSSIAKLKMILVLALLSLLTTSYCANDWLINNIQDEVTLKESKDGLVLNNSLISRVFTTTPGFGTLDYRSETTQSSLLRIITPEAYVTLDNIEYPIGGLTSSVPHSYLNRTGLKVLPGSFVYSGYTKSAPVAPFHWEPGLRYSPSTGSWPPKGLTLSVHFKAPPNVTKSSHKAIIVTVNYEMYVGIPLLAKWLTVQNTVSTPVSVDRIVIEYIGTQKPYAPFSLSSQPGPWEHDTSALTTSWLYVEANVPHGALIQWATDPLSIVSPGADEPTLNCTYSTGPGLTLAASSDKVFKNGLLPEFDTYRVLELVTDSDDRERVALSRHRMTRLLAPQTQENPIFFHGTDSSDTGFQNSIDQMAAVGFEMYIYSFGSGFNLENLDKANIDKIAADIKYAKAKGIEVGGYDLIDLERGHGGYGGNVGDQWDAVNPSNGQLTKDACFASGWYDKINNVIFTFLNQTGLSMFETDGPYGGGVCASTNHTHHSGMADSVYWQTRLQAQLYSELRARNVFINQPDNYFYWGGSKSGMGYNENQYSLPRWEDLSVSRQGMYDDTYHFLPTQGWMFVPLVVYHGGGTAAEFEPLSQNLADYEWALAQYLGYGVAACYRGPRLYDSDTVMGVVKKWVGFYKTYRDILISDIVHVRRPDMQDYDCILHVNPGLVHRGLAMIFNPTDSVISRTISLPLYYTGLTDKALVMLEGQSPGTMYTLDREFHIHVTITMEARSVTWILVQETN